MSAFMVTREDIALIVDAAIDSGEFDSTETELINQFGQLLVNENAASVDFRYKDASNLFDYGTHVPGYFRAVASSQVVATLKSYRYQACEHSTWESSTAFQATARMVEFFSAKD